MERAMSWILLVLAGLLETGWAIGLKYTEGFTRPLPTALTIAAIIGSMALLGLALRDLPVGTAYAVWVGIGAFGTAVLGILLFGEPATPARLLFLGLLVIAIGGLKLTAPDA
jgi:quaternary ammonium compound-resistance protein SugE